MFHLAAFAEDVDLAGAESGLTALADTLVETSGDIMQVPELNKIIALAGGLAADTALEGYMKLTAPSMLAKFTPYVMPLNGAADADVEPSTPHRVNDLRKKPLTLVANEQLEVKALGDSTAAAFQWMLIWFSDGVMEIPEGEIFSMRFTAAITLTARTWTQGALTFAERLPVGTYAVVGMRSAAVSNVAGRLIFRGKDSGGWRPGVMGVDNEGDQEHEMFRFGGLGEFGRFHSLTPPIGEWLSDLGDTAESGILDLIQVGSGLPS